MRERARRLLPLLILVLCSFAAVLSAAQIDPLQDEFNEEGRVQPHEQQTPLSHEQSRPDPANANTITGAGSVQDTHKVDEARTLLRKISQSQSRRTSKDKSSGFTSTATYWAKEAFFWLFLNSPIKNEGRTSSRPDLRLSPPLQHAVQLLEEASQNKNPDALFILAELSFYGNHSYPRDYPSAFKRYLDLASMTGNSTAQHMIGFMYATGIGGSVERDQSKALLYHTFAALGGDVRSEMTVAHRHHSAISTPRNCDEAAFYYKRTADKAISFWRSGPVGGHILTRHAYRLADENGGVYGEGASVSSSGVNAVKSSPNSDTYAALDDVIEYLDLMSRKGDLKATFSLGKIHYDGSRILQRDVKLAKKYFTAIARSYWSKDGKVDPNAPESIAMTAGRAAGYLGRILMRGEIKEQNFERAATWYRRGVASGDALSQNGMGLLYLNGWGVRKNAIKAADYFKAAADQNFPPAQLNLGKLYLDQGDTQIAIRYFELAVRHGHIEAFYILAELANQGVGRERSCGMATAYYKIVTEKVEPLVSSFIEANRAFEDGDLETALAHYMMAAEQGFEAAQANVAYLLDEQKSRIPLNRLLPFTRHKPPLLRNAALALIFWTRSAKQANIDSMVKMGDYYLAGVGTDRDSEKAASCYNAAAEFLQSAQALWNLGWMHENGIGVEQDFHLAKRFYDQALETNQEAYLPVSLALLKLRVRSFWNTITNGRVNSIRTEPEPDVKWSLSEWLNNFLGDDHPYFDDADDDDDYAAPIQGSLPGGDDLLDDINDGILESVFIVGLAGVLAFLVYYRQQRRLARRRAAEGGNAALPNNGRAGAAVAPAAEGAPNANGDRGLFPRPDDPEYAQWVAGGIGH